MPEILGVGVLWAFLAGLLSFLSPCVLPLVPGYVSYVAGKSLDDMTASGFSKARLTALALSGSFALGFSTVFIALGASATALGQLFQSYRSEADLVAGAVVTLFGLHMTGVLRLGFLNRDIRFHGLSREGTVAGAFVLGAAFAFGWTPCIGPILGSILTLSMATSTISGGMTLLAIYSLGLAVPFLLVAAFTSAFSLVQVEPPRNICRRSTGSRSLKRATSFPYAFLLCGTSGFVVCRLVCERLDQVFDLGSSRCHRCVGLGFGETE